MNSGFERFRMVLEKIPMQRIDFGDQAFSLAPPAPSNEKVDPRELIDSVEAVSLLHPPFLRTTPGKEYQVVAGWNRLHAVRRLEGRACSCFILDAATQDRHCLEVAFHDLVQSGLPLTPAERAIFMKKILAHVPPEEAARSYLPFMGLTPRPSQLRDMRLLAEIEEPLLLALHQGRLDEKAALMLQRLSFSDRLALFDIIETLRLSVSNQRKLIETCQELACRQNRSIVSTLQDRETLSVLDHPEANPPQKTANLMALLRERRYPGLSGAEKEFKAFVSALRLPANASVGHAMSFENDDVTLSLSFPNRQTLAEIWPRMADLVKTEKLEQH